jgi:hypothetical protein
MKIHLKIHYRQRNIRLKDLSEVRIEEGTKVTISTPSNDTPVNINLIDNNSSINVENSPTNAAAAGNVNTGLFCTIGGYYPQNHNDLANVFLVRYMQDINNLMCYNMAIQKALFGTHY